MSPLDYDFRAHPLDKAALFWTASTPIEASLIEHIRKEADKRCNLDPPIRIELIQQEGSFVGRTPFQIASRYVMPKLAVDPTDGFANQTFVIVDDETLKTGDLLLLSIDWDSYKPDAEVKIEGALRIGQYFASQLPVLFHDGIKSTFNFGGEAYDYSQDDGRDS